ncbi:alpha/beta fold hydrolase [Echinicola shivajiensis]|uniref:alpha/beta fold hydrolase n=1 Tax=Echinicola shivajiensis TaxID=1035916 RepID=UPI001BFC378A|nr:alpha/beta hydrolase [Echinicola shivajiensis]
MKNQYKSLVMFAFSVLLTACSESFDSVTKADTFFHVKVDESVLPVWVKGNTASKKLVIYLNGGPGLTSLDVAKADMFDWSESLEKDLAMVYYDQRGCGNAQGKFDESSLNIEQFVKDLDAIVTVLKAKYENTEIYLMGHSFGSFIGVNYLLTADSQNKISGWISVDGAYNFDYDLSWQYRRSFLINIANEEIAKGNHIAHWTEALAWASETPRIESREDKNAWRDFIGFPGGIIIPEELADLSFGDYLGIGFASSYNPFPAYLSQNLAIVNDRLNEDAEGTNLIANVEKLSLPTLFIWGRYDDLIAPEEGMDVFENLGTPAEQKKFVLFLNSSHEPYINESEKFQSEIINFVMD